MRAIFLFSLGLISALGAAPEGAELSSEHEALSQYGHTRTKLSWAIPESLPGKFWLVVNRDCANPERIVIPDAEKLEGSFPVDVNRLDAGENPVHLCQENSQGRVKTIASLTLYQEDAAPDIRLEPPPGDFSTAPSIQIHGSANTVKILYTQDGSYPRFAGQDLASQGQAYDAAFTLAGKETMLKAVAISRAGVVSPVISGSYRIDPRSTGWNERTILVGYEYVATLGAVQDYLPVAHGVSAGFRLGLDSWFNAGGSSMMTRRHLIPGVLTQGRYLSYRNGGYREEIISVMAGPEWVFPLHKTKPVFLLTGISPGMSRVSVSTPKKVDAGFVFSMQMHLGVEWQLGMTGLFAHFKYVWFADEVAALHGGGASIGALLRL